MGMRFLKFHPDHLFELEDYYPAELYYEYLVSCLANPYVPKDRDGYFERSVDQIYKDMKFKKAVQVKARDILLRKGFIAVALHTNRRSPALAFKVLEKR